jgi:hypothetical protein
MSRTGADVDLTGETWTLPVAREGDQVVLLSLRRLDEPAVADASAPTSGVLRRASSLSPDLRHALKLYLVHRMTRLSAHTVRYLFNHFCAFERHVFRSRRATALAPADFDFALFVGYADACRDGSVSRGAAPTSLRSFYVWAADTAQIPGFDPKVAARMRRLRLPTALRGHIVRMACPRRGALDANEQLQIDRAILTPLPNPSTLDFKGRIVAGLCRDLGCRPAALVRMTRTHRVPPLVTKQGTRYLIREPVVKQATATNATRDRGVSDEVGQLVEELYRLAPDKRGDAPLLYFLFEGQYRYNPQLKLGRLLRAWADLRDITTTRIPREREGYRNSRLAHNRHPTGARIVIFPYRFRRTLATTMAEQGASQEEIAEALGDKTTAMAAVYVENSSYIVDILARTLDKHPEWISVIHIFQGKIASIADTVLPAVLAGAPQLANYPEYAEAGVAGYCAKDGDCELWLPLSCYECPFFRASRERDVHERQLLQVVQELEIRAGVESIRLQESLMRAVRAIVQLLKLMEAEQVGTTDALIERIRSKRVRPAFVRPAPGTPT